MLKEIYQSLGISCQIFLVGDGSGSLAKDPCGWYTGVYYPETDEEGCFYGAFSTGTNNCAELMPYVQALSSHWALKRPERQTVIISDSLITVNCGNRKNSRSANLPLWAAIDCIVAYGYNIQWIHMPRNSNGAMRHADEFSKEIREVLKHGYIPGNLRSRVAMRK